MIVASLLALFAFGELKTASLVMGFVCCAGLFALCAAANTAAAKCERRRDAGAAGGQMAFNLGSAIGAYFGGMMITLGFSWSYVTLPAAILSFSAMTSLLMYGYLCAKASGQRRSAGLIPMLPAGRGCWSGLHEFRQRVSGGKSNRFVCCWRVNQFVGDGNFDLLPSSRTDLMRWSQPSVYTAPQLPKSRQVT